LKAFTAQLPLSAFSFLGDISHQTVSSREQAAQPCGKNLQFAKKIVLFLLTRVKCHGTINIKLALTNYRNKSGAVVSCFYALWVSLC
jgi:hypothetical protein